MSNGSGRRIARLFKPYRTRLLGLLGLIVISAGLGVIPAFLLRDLLNNVLTQGTNVDTTRLNILVAGMVAIPIITGVIGVAQTWLSNRIGQDVMHDLRELKKEGEVGEDDERRAESELQRLTDEATSEIESLLKGKEEEILEV